MANIMNDSQFSKAFFKMITYLTVLLLILIGIGVVVGSSMDAKLKDQAKNYTQSLIAERTQPTGNLNVGEIEEVEEIILVAEAPKSGKEVYTTACYICHDPGLTGAPKPGDAENWNPRIEKGVNTLYTNAIGGYQGETGIMPPKGGNLLLSDDEVKAAVDYLIELVQ